MLHRDPKLAYGSVAANAPAQQGVNAGLGHLSASAPCWRAPRTCPEYSPDHQTLQYGHNLHSQAVRFAKRRELLHYSWCFVIHTIGISILYIVCYLTTGPIDRKIGLTSDSLLCYGAGRL